MHERTQDSGAEDEPREFRQIQRARVLDLLEEVRQLHQRLAAYYHEVGEQARDEHTALLLHYLETHEKLVQNTMDEYEHDASQSVLQSWVRYAQNIPVDQLVERARLSPDARPEEVAGVTAEISDFLIGAFESIAKKSAVPEVEEALLNLRDVEERAKIRALRGADEDMT